MITCPNCHSDMKEVTLPEHYGTRQVAIEQCPQCGGLWFDADEFYKVKTGEALALEKIDINKLSENTALGSALACPKDGHALRVYKDPYFFKEIQILSCDACRGFWFNRGEFTKYQSERSKKEQKSTGASSLAQSILQLENFKKDLEAKERLQTFIRPQLPSMLPSVENADTGDWRLNIVLDIVEAIVRRIFR